MLPKILQGSKRPVKEYLLSARPASLLKPAIESGGHQLGSTTSVNSQLADFQAEE